ncbi:NAD(P)/FAD-dependent oxidoreductase [Granulicella sp. S190]|uniref:flavin monoamine oxidase family protein n=1 Tax=Granulicella sp. S190 TaxID=1747226 RepID=UPI00131E4EA5|nr:NAD(P)/FAD-dependent oxidoreductase [Granulicella sp. S190]
MNQMNDVVVVGAGMAGLTAARALAEAGMKVLVVEAQERIGGRILTQHVGGEAIELGAEFIHGRPPELWALIEEAGLETYERGGAQIYFEDGTLRDCGGQMDGVFDPLEKLENFAAPDISFAEYLEREEVPVEDRGRLIGYVEGFNAADHREISAASLGAQQKAEDATEGDRIFRLRGGYDQLPAYLSQRIEEYGGTVVTGVPVKEIRWSPGRAEVVTASGSFVAAKAVVTLPLGVLQRGDVIFSPPVSAVDKVASRLRMGQVRRFTLLFRERFWESLEPQPGLSEMSFLFSFSEMPPVWWTPHPERSNSLTGWVGGPRSIELAGMSAEQIAREACAALGKIFDVQQERLASLLVGCCTHDWQHDEFSGGSYSYVAKGGLDASMRMTEPVSGTLFFAGEHTDVTGHWGTVHAAMRSGLRAAAQILEASAASQR